MALSLKRLPAAGLPARPWIVTRQWRLPPRGLVGLYAAVSYLILVALAASSMVLGSNAVQNQVALRLAATSTASAAYVGQTLQARASALAAFAGQPAIADAMAGGVLDEAGKLTVIAAMAQLLITVEGSYSAFLLWPNGVMAYSSINPAGVGSDFSFRDYYTGAMASRGTYISAAYGGTNAARTLVVSESTRIVNSRGGLVGIMGISFDLRRLQEFVDTLATANGVGLLVADQAGVVVVQPGATVHSLIKSSDPNVIAALHGRSGAGDRSGKNMVAYAPISWAHWALVVQLPRDVALSDLYLLQRSVLLIAALLALVNLGMILLLDAAMSRRARAELQLAAAYANLEQRVADRTQELQTANRELEAFTHSVSHDLRAPLRALSGFANLLKRQEGSRLDPESRQYLDRIDANSKKMGTLIDELLKLSRLGRASMKIETVDTCAVATAAVQDLREPAQESGVEVEIGWLPPCQADRALLQQVYANLVSNAIKFSAGRPGARVDISAHVDSGRDVFDVSDNGVGFDMRYADKLFTVFQRLHSQAEFEGTGVGLALVQRIIHRHGGRVWAEGEPGSGAAFHFTLEGD